MQEIVWGAGRISGVGLVMESVQSRKRSKAEKRMRWSACGFGSGDTIRKCPRQTGLTLITTGRPSDLEIFHFPKKGGSRGLRFGIVSCPEEAATYLTLKGHNSAVSTNFASSQYILETSRRDLLVGELLFSLPFFHGVISREKPAASRALGHTSNVCVDTN